jgi:folate-binding protein YgfZ
MISGSGSESLVEKVQWHSAREISPSVFSTTLNVTSAIEQLQTITHLVIPAGQGYSDLLRIRAGTADVLEQTSDAFIVQMINLDALDYISFKKGCYTGQEIVARAHYRGAVKRRLYRIGLDTEVSPPLKQDLMNTEGKVIGTIAAVAPASNTTVEVLAILAIKSTDCSKVKFGDQDLVPMRLLPLPYELPTSS